MLPILNQNPPREGQYIRLNFSIGILTGDIS